MQEFECDENRIVILFWEIIETHVVSHFLENWEKVESDFKAGGCFIFHGWEWDPLCTAVHYSSSTMSRCDLRLGKILWSLQSLWAPEHNAGLESSRLGVAHMMRTQVAATLRRGTRVKIKWSKI
ncbi:hypothetical protein CRG98_024040 [Punica granatum]|uniref:Uncharacterized protein n=1 Tax=Punica granatum TaxID=22663 RepID=A0A2I0JI03_PUNGR|nr:hypothetical protein CRG98_024040 [Punica granatum]